MSSDIAMAIGAHPDDIESMMGGTLILLRRAGFQTHYLNLASGSCGSTLYPAATLRAIRRRESRAAAKIMGAVFHESLVDDLEVYYERSTLRRLAGVIREVRPCILLVPSPQDYMEDHTNACRLAVTAAFVRNMPNFHTVPRRGSVPDEVTVYHAMPHGLCDPMRRRIVPGEFVDTTGVQKIKTAALARHRSQQRWLDASQRMNCYLGTMAQFSIKVGRLSGKFRHAEGWRRHLHYGFCAEDSDPLRAALGRDCLVNRRYESALEAAL
jgi:N-acetylglucosamine malate deacetylase 1